MKTRKLQVMGLAVVLYAFSSMALSGQEPTPEWTRIELLPDAPIYFAKWKGTQWSYVPGPVGMLPVPNVEPSLLRQVLRVHINTAYLPSGAVSHEVTEQGGNYDSYLTAQGRAAVENLINELDEPTVQTSGQTSPIKSQIIGEDWANDNVDVLVPYPYGYFLLGALAKIYDHSPAFPSQYEKVFFDTALPFVPPVLVDDALGHSMREAFVKNTHYNYVDYVWDYPMTRLTNLGFQVPPPPSNAGTTLVPPPTPTVDPQFTQEPGAAPENQASQSPSTATGAQASAPPTEVQQPPQPNTGSQPQVSLFPGERPSGIYRAGEFPGAN